jgi:hypothetical protein
MTPPSRPGENLREIIFFCGLDDIAGSGAISLMHINNSDRK